MQDKKSNNKGRGPKKSNNKVKGNRNYNPKSKGPKMDQDESAETTHRYNDVSWYSKNPQMLADAASYSYNRPLGDKLPQWYHPVSDSTSYNLTGATIPGLMVLRFAPTIGTSSTSTSPANLAAQNIYTYVRYMNSGAKNYDQADLMLYLLAMDSVYYMWNDLKRMYGYLRSYSQLNKYMPKAFAYADGLDFEDAIANMADFRYHINQLAARISSFCVPAVMPYFIRHSWLCANLYSDSNNAKAQIYMLRPTICYKYAETESQFGGSLVPVKVPGVGSKTTYKAYVKIVNDLLDQIGYSEDIGVMSGDILKAYGQNQLFKISPVEPDYSVYPVYNEEVLNQLHNSTVVNTGTADLSVTQNPNTGFLVYDPHLPLSDYTQDRAFINMPWDVVTPANTMVGTRLTAIAQKVSGQNYGSLVAVGSEFITARQIVYRNVGTTHTTEFMTIDVPNQIIVKSWENADAIKAAVVIAPLTSNFDWHPLLPVWVGEKLTNETIYHYIGMMGDVTNYTTIAVDELAMMHQTAVLSEFNVPQIGSF